MNRLDQLDTEVLNAHASGDLDKIIQIYSDLGYEELENENVDAACFLLTQAYVYSLEAGHPDTVAIHKTLVKFGREE